MHSAHTARNYDDDDNDDAMMKRDGNNKKNNEKWPNALALQMCVPFLHTIIGSKGDSHCQRDCHSLEYGHVIAWMAHFFLSSKSLLSCTFDIEFGAVASFIYYHLCKYRPRADVRCN